MKEIILKRRYDVKQSNSGVQYGDIPRRLNQIDLSELVEVISSIGDRVNFRLGYDGRVDNEFMMPDECAKEIASQIWFQSGGQGLVFHLVGYSGDMPDGLDADGYLIYDDLLIDGVQVIDLKVDVLK